MYARLSNEDEEAQIELRDSELSAIPLSSTAHLRSSNSAENGNQEKRESTSGAAATEGAGGGGEGGMTLSVLLKEDKFTVRLSDIASTTVENLKVEVEKATKVPVNLQRIIYSGRPLKPDSALLSTFKIQNESTLHLFPSVLPTAVPSTASSSSGVTAVNVEGAPYIVQYPGMMSSQPAFTHLPIHFDPYINQTSREVKLWSLILIFLSGVTLFDNFSFIVSTGRMGNDPLDALVVLMDVLCSIGGIKVGQMGLQSARTVDLHITKIYVRNLTMLGICSTLMRITWVVDKILEVKVAVEGAQNMGDGSGGSKGLNGGVDGVDDPTPQNEDLNGNVLKTFAVQAILLALICVAAWISCVYRAYRFRHAVETYQEAMGAVTNPLSQVIHV